MPIVTLLCYHSTPIIIILGVTKYTVFHVVMPTPNTQFLQTIEGASPDMRIVPVGSSGNNLGSFWFLKIMRENWSFGGYILSGL